MRFLDWEFYQHATELGSGRVWTNGGWTELDADAFRFLALDLPDAIPLVPLAKNPHPPLCIVVDTSATCWQLYDLPFVCGVHALPRSYGNSPNLHTHEHRVAECVSSILAAEVPDDVVLVGLCSGAITAFDVATRLSRRGRSVSRVVLISPTFRELEYPAVRDDVLSGWSDSAGYTALSEMYEVAKARRLLADWVTFERYRLQILEYVDRCASALSSGWSSPVAEADFAVELVLCDDTPRGGWWTSLQGDVRLTEIRCRQGTVYRRDELRSLLTESAALLAAPTTTHNK